MSIGTLLDQVIYPETPEDFSKRSGGEEKVRSILSLVSLAHVLQREGLHALRDWRNTLSGGEKQRMAMARLFYHRYVTRHTVSQFFITSYKVTQPSKNSQSFTGFHEVSEFYRVSQSFAEFCRVSQQFIRFHNILNISQNFEKFHKISQTFTNINNI